MPKRSKKNSAKLNILWLTSSYPRCETDSASIFLRYLANSISKKDHEINILSPDHINIKKNFQDPFITKFYFKYFFPRRLQKLAYDSGILHNLKTNPFLLFQIPFFLINQFIYGYLLVRKLNPSVIHAHWIFPQGTIASLIGKISGTPVIITAHGSDTFSLKGSLLTTIKYWSINNCAAWTSNTIATAQALGPLIKKPIIIPMGIDYKKFSTGTSAILRKKTPENTLILLFVGRLVKKKGVDDLLTAYSLLSSTYKNQTQLWIVGDGAERNTLEKQSNLLNLKNNVTFWGKLSNDHLPNYYAAADIFIAPSIIEGQGIMLLEAMASGTAIISTSTGGINEIINHGINGLLTPPKKPTKLKCAIVQFIKDQRLRETIAKNGKQTALSYDWAIISQQFSMLYKQKMQKPK